MRLHHVQVACPAGDEDVARRFYADGLGLTEVAKPAALAGRGGAWFRSPAGAKIHWSQRDSFPGHVRCHTFDGHGNRVELLAEA